jgi:phosphoglycolate phosphatase-like HAD superfamily hydrolase
MKMKAVLFDIDGTILNCNKAGKHSLIQACLDVFGTIGKMEMVDFQGKTDPLILTESLSAMGFSDEIIKNRTEELKEKYFSHLEENIIKYDILIMPGIPELLKILSLQKNIILGILTGNFKKSAEIKIAAAGVKDYFPFGAYGDDAHNRNDLPPVAKKLINEIGIDMDFNDIFIIGDTVYDIECAKNSGAVSISVGTGWADKEKLLSCNPDFYFEDLSDTEKVLSIILDF